MITMLHNSHQRATIINPPGEYACTIKTLSRVFIEKNKGRLPPNVR